MRKAWRRPSLPFALLGLVAMGGCGAAEAQQPAPIATAGPDWPTLIAGALGGLAALGSLVGGGTYARRKWTQPPGDPAPSVEERVAVLEERSDTERHESRLLRKKVHKIGNVVFALAHAAGIDPDEVEDSDEDEPAEKP